MQSEFSREPLDDPPVEQAQAVDRSSLVLLHVSQFCGYIVPPAGFVAPIVIWQLMKESSREIDQHGRVVANWIISSVIWAAIICVLCLVLIGIPLAFAFGAVCIVFPIIGAVKASNGAGFGSIR